MRIPMMLIWPGGTYLAVLVYMLQKFSFSPLIVYGKAIPAKLLKQGSIVRVGLLL